MKHRVTFIYGQEAIGKSTLARAIADYNRCKRNATFQMLESKSMDEAVEFLKKSSASEVVIVCNGYAPTPPTPSTPSLARTTRYIKLNDIP